MSSTPTRVTDSPRNDLQALDLAFLGSLLPGIIHNWATPLSGVIGATQLLERRGSAIKDLLENYDSLSRAERDELQKQLERNRTNVEILSRNAQHLADLLQVLVQRITRGNGSARDFFPLNELMQNELRFLESSLQFKHKVRKTISLETAVPATSFSYGYVAAAVDEVVTFVIGQHDYAQGVMEMDFHTVATDHQARITITARYAASGTADEAPDPLRLYMTRLEGDGWTVAYDHHPGQLTLALSRPLREPA